MTYPPPNLPVPPIQPVYKTTNHLLHLVMSFLTCGLWLLVWPFVYLVTERNNKEAAQLYQQRLVEYNQAMQVYQDYHRG